MALNRHLRRAEMACTITDIVIQSRAMQKKIEELDGFRDEFWAISNATSYAAAMVDHLFTEEEFRRAEMTIVYITSRAQALSKRINEFEEKCQRYNIPKLTDSETIVDQVTRVYAISRHLIEYFLLMAKRDDIEFKIDNVSVIVRYLRVKHNSNIIKSFSSVVELVKKKIRDSGKRSMDLEENVSYDETEVEFHHMILQEVLRLDVALYSPHLPMMSVEDVYLSKGGLLRIEFEDTLKKVSWKMNELKTELSSTRVGDEDPETWNHLKEETEVGIKEIWNNLDIES
ncbi:hypothetical protein TorRG33x02_192690 [Trema orientale]|uniref:Uncharacterized protein n=1 Tax=Trema orientale TaxID=63057 RepID=A0A2P5EHJ2_TREOI|nr:hypothetical protein TorRG33x02_192690 [Trema orientale]